MPVWFQGAGREARGLEPLPAESPVLELLLVAACLALSFAAGWLFAAHGDPDGVLMRQTLGLLIGEFR